MVEVKSEKVWHSYVTSVLDTIERVRKRFVEEGIESALNRREQKNRRSRIIDGEKEAYLIAIACSQTPAGKSHCPLQMLADKMVELKVVSWLKKHER